MAIAEKVAPFPAIEQFAIPQGWRITSWNLSPGSGIPSNGFTVQGTLLIGIARGPAPACDLNWLDSAGEQCSMTKLPFQDGELRAGVFPVRFGGSVTYCYVALSLDNTGVLNGRLDTLDVDGNTGTFAADANPGG